MENSENKDEYLSNEDLVLNEDTISLLYQVRKWSYFCSIIGMILVGLQVLAAFSIPVIFSSIPFPDKSMNILAGAYGFTYTIIYLVQALIYFFPVFFLLRFSLRLKDALDSNDSDILINSFKNLKNFFQYIGILGILLLILIIGALLFVATFFSLFAGIITEAVKAS